MLSLARNVPETQKRVSHFSKRAEIRSDICGARNGAPPPGPPQTPATLGLPPAAPAYLSLRQVLVRPQQVRREERLRRPEVCEEAVGAEQRGRQEPALARDAGSTQKHPGRRRRRSSGHPGWHVHPGREGLDADTAPSSFSANGRAPEPRARAGTCKRARRRLAPGSRCLESPPPAARARPPNATSQSGPPPGWPRPHSRARPHAPPPPPNALSLGPPLALARHPAWPHLTPRPPKADAHEPRPQEPPPRHHHHQAAASLPASPLASVSKDRKAAGAARQGSDVGGSGTSDF